jgi:hypothetical protein
MLLQALVACAGVTLGAVATTLGIKLSGGTLTAEGDIDFRGTLGIARDVPVGFKEIRLYASLNTDASSSQREKLLALTERYCVVYQTLLNGSKSALLSDCGGEPVRRALLQGGGQDQTMAGDRSPLALPNSHFASLVYRQVETEGTARPIVRNSPESPAMCLDDRAAGPDQQPQEGGSQASPSPRTLHFDEVHPPTGR